MNIPIEVENFYRFFWKTPICQDIFLLHKELLLEKNSLELITVADYYLQRIIISTSITTREEIEEHLAFRQENKYAGLLSQLNESKDKYFDEEKLIAYIKNKFGYAFNLASKDYKEKKINFILTKIAPRLGEGIEGLIKLLKEYKAIPESIEHTEEALSKYFEIELRRESGDFLRKQDMSDILLTVDTLSHVYNSVLKDTLINGYKQNLSTLIDKENLKNRLKVFDRLYEIGILIGGKFKSYVECMDCPPDTFNAFITWNIKPSKAKVKCPQCKKHTNSLVPYYIHDDLYSHIKDTDGVLSFALEYIFYKKGISYLKNHNLENANEIDFILGSVNHVRALIEVKMFRNDKDDGVKLSNLKSTISQIKKTRIKLSEIDNQYIEVPHFLVTNISDEQLIKEARAELKNDLKAFHISIFTPMEFHDYINDKW